MNRVSRLAPLVGVLVLQACEGGARGGDIAYDELPAAEVDAICEYMVRCGMAASVPLCADVWDWLLHGDPDLDAAVAGGSVKYDEDAAEACLEAIRGAACTSGFFQGVPSGACDDVFKGTVADGGACWIDEQCVSQQCEAAGCAEACCAGVCVAAPPPAAIGQPCGDGCVEGAYCDALNDVCAALKGDGAACDGFDECAAGLGCLAGSCQKGPGEGEPCLEFQCALPLACDPGTITCKPLPGEGEACVAQANNCKIGLGCDPATMTCVAPGGVGSACAGSFFNSGCAGETYCAIDQGGTSGTCQPLKADGAACVDEGECKSRDCANGACTTPQVCVP